MKVAFLCCRYYPLISWPVILWAFVGDHDTEFCRVVVKPIFIFMIPYVCLIGFSDSLKPYDNLSSAVNRPRYLITPPASGVTNASPLVVMVIRAWTFSGRQTHILYFLLFAYFAVVIIQIWVLATGVEGSKPEVLYQHVDRLFDFICRTVKESPVMKIVGKFGCIRGPGPGPLISGNRVGVRIPVFPHFKSEVILLMVPLHVGDVRGCMPCRFSVHFCHHSG